MKKITVTIVLLVGISFAANCQNASTANTKKNKNTGCYTQKNHSEPKSYARKKFLLADVFRNRSKGTATENEKKPLVSKPRNSYANNEQSIVKSKHGVTSR